MLNKDCIRIDLMSISDLVLFNELIKIGVIRFDLSIVAHVEALTHIINTVRDFGAKDVSKLSEQGRLIHQQKLQLMVLTVQRLLQVANSSDMLKLVS